jgi:hypothetical protein
MSTGLALASLLLFLGMFFFFLVFPIWMIIHCAMAQDRKTISKILWIILILTSWLLGSLVYGLFGSHKPLIKRISASIFILGFLSFFLFVSFLYQTSRIVASDSMERVAMLKAGELTQEHIDQMKGNLNTLAQDLNSAKGLRAIYLIKNTYKDLMLNQLFIVMMKDGQMMVSEYSEWMDRFNHRSQMDPKALGEYLKSLEQKQAESIDKGIDK